MSRLNTPAGRALRVLRAANDWTGKELAENSKLTVAQIQRIEAGYSYKCRHLQETLGLTDAEYFVLTSESKQAIERENNAEEIRETEDEIPEVLQKLWSKYNSLNNVQKEILSLIAA